jgi:hypothetical protein
MAKKQIINLIEIGEKPVYDSNGRVKLDDDGRGITERAFMVDTIKNSIDYKAGQKITLLQAHDLVANSAFEVNFRRPRNSDFS